MEIYLVQHGEAKSEQDDPQRPLSEKGSWDVVQAAGRLAKADLRVGLIVHSGKLRAKQTAEILSNHLKPGNGVREMLGLAPNDSVTVAKEFINTAREPIMLVGHLPHLGKLSSLMLSNDENSDIISFRMGCVVCLEKDEKWKVRWVMQPDMPY